MKEARRTLSTDKVFGPGPSKVVKWHIYLDAHRLFEGRGKTAIEAAHSVGLTLGETLSCVPFAEPEDAPKFQMPADPFAQLRGSRR